MMDSPSPLLATPAMPPPMMAPPGPPEVMPGIPPGRGLVSRPPIKLAAAACADGLIWTPGWPLLWGPLNPGGEPGGTPLTPGGKAGGAPFRPGEEPGGAPGITG